MTEPTDTESLIAGHFDGMNSPAENALLTELLLSDPRAAESFVEAARFEAMLEQRMPLVKSRKRPLWLWLGAAAALAAAAFFTLRLLPGQESTPADGELKWVPVKDAQVPLTGHSAWALQAWEQMQKAEPDSFVPVPEVTLEEWRIEEEPEPVLKLRTTAKYPADWKRKLNQARSCTVGKDGVIDLGDGKSIKLSYIAMASPRWPESKPASEGGEGFYITPPVYFDHFGSVINDPERISNGEGLMTMQSRNYSAIELGLDMSDCSGGRVLSLGIFDAASHAWLRRGASGSLPDLPKIIVRTQALICSTAPITIALEVAVPSAETITLPATPGSKARTSLEEAYFVKGSEGIWISGGGSASSGNTSGWEEWRLRNVTADDGRVKMRHEQDNTPRKQSCTLAVSLSGELEADLLAVTDSGDVSPLKQYGPFDESRSHWVRLVCFPTPLESVRAVKIKPHSRRRVLLTVTPPKDPWNGLNTGITDALELRIPSLHPQTDDARITMQTLLGIDEPKTYKTLPSGNPDEPQFKWLFGKDWNHGEMKNASLREILLELGRIKQQEIEIEVPTRRLRSVPIR